MNPFAGKSSTERNKIIAAIVLGFVALAALYLAFGRNSFSGSTTSAGGVTPTPKASASPLSSNSTSAIPSQQEQISVYTTTPIDYRPGISTPDPGRNIFAFYEPPPPCDPSHDPNGCVKPTPIKTPPTPTPTPTPPMHLEFVTPQTIYAGSGSFRLELNGDKFDPAAKIVFNGSQLPTQFVSPQKIFANVPATMISNEGSRTVIAQTSDGKLYSEQKFISVQAPPKPSFKYIGAKLAARGNNDTGYFQEDGKPTPTAARLGDVVGGRFRLISISRNEALFEDVSLPFKHPLKMEVPAPGTASTQTNAPRGFPNRFPNNDPNVYVPYNPNGQPQENIPGIPNNIPRAQPQNNQRPPQKKDPNTKDEDDDDGGGGN
jgi:hypothetical protein